MIDEDSTPPALPQQATRRPLPQLCEEQDAPLLHPASAAYAGLVLMDELVTRAEAFDAVNRK